MCLGVLCVCDDQTVTVTIYECRFSGGTYIANEKADYTCTINKGEKFTFKDYYDIAVDPTIDGGAIPLGFYLDSNCEYKYDDDQTINADTVLYVTYYVPGDRLIDFSYQGNIYTVIIRDNDAFLSAEVFNNAYGKTIDVSTLKFYGDPDCTKEINLSSYTFATLTVRDDGVFPQRKTIYVM